MRQQEQPDWKTSSFCSGGAPCVQVWFDDDGTAHVRDSKLGDDSPVLDFTPAEWRAFAAGVKGGEFDRSARAAGVNAST